MSGATGGFETGEAAINTVQNSGLIEARDSGVAVAGGTLSLNNTGRLLAPGSAVAASALTGSNTGEILSRNAVAIVVGGALSFANYAAGVISGGISAGGSSPSTFSNFGSVTGAVAFGAGADTLVNTGSITGNVDLGGGNNVVTNPGAIYGSLTTGAGVDTIDLRFGKVSGMVVAGLGGDTVTGGESREVIYGDDLASTDTAGGNDVIDAGGGDDLVFGGYGADVISGGWGDDVLNGGYGQDQLYGNQGDDVLYGNQDDDWIHGGQGNDILYGGQGNDKINGGVGNDVLYGNLGNDTFVFSAAGFGQDVVADFSRVAGNTDQISFGAGIFAGFADLQARAIQMPNGVLLTDAAGDTLFIVGATTGGLTADMFVIG